tara:strand:- start:1021 stop:2019 length:999 start_codon:yes stop_codon:yes gene_type:complete
MKNNLFVNYNIDAGNITMGKNIKEILQNSFDYYNFIPYKNKRNLINKAISSIHLRKTLKKYNKSNKIIFNSIGPATWGYGSYNINNAIIMLDWTRSFENFAYEKKIKKDIIHFFQSYILKKFPKILCRTNKIMKNLSDCYGVKYSQMKKIPAPLDVELFNIPPRPTPLKPRVLFIGNDFDRKGGSFLINHLDQILEKFELTIVSSDKKADISGINYIDNLLYGSLSHKKIFYNHDILILPSRIEPYGMVIAEAASAGLAIITTKYAFASADLIQNEFSGIITENQIQCVEALLNLAKNHSLIDIFKSNIYKSIHMNFSKHKLEKIYMNILTN